MIGARNEQNAPMVVQKPIPAANAGPLNNWGGNVQNTGWTDKNQQRLNIMLQ